MGRVGARPGDDEAGGAARPVLRVARGGLCGGKAGRLPLPWGPYRLMMKAVSRGAVDAVWCAVAVVFEGAIQLMKPMLTAKLEPVE